MKKVNVTINIRKGMRFATILLAAGLLLSSCKKDSSTTTSDAVSDDEVAESVTESVSASSGGMAMQTQSTAQMASTSTLACGGSSDTVITGQSLAAAVIAYSYNLKFSRSLTCTNGIPTAFNINFTGSSSYTAPRMSSSDNSSAQFIITGILPTSSTYTLNENYIRNGTQQSSFRSIARSYTSTITIVSTNIVVNKSTMKIVSGTASVQFIGTTTSGTISNRSGTITFLGGGQATLTLANGSSYPIQW